jgi:hypothetical protein
MATWAEFETAAPELAAVAARLWPRGTATNDALFEFDLDRVDVAYWVDIGQPGTHAVRPRWTLQSGCRE